MDYIISEKRKVKGGVFRRRKKVPRVFVDVVDRARKASRNLKPFTSDW